MVILLKACRLRSFLHRPVALLGVHGHYWPFVGRGFPAPVCLPEPMLSIATPVPRMDSWLGNSVIHYCSTASLVFVSSLLSSSCLAAWRSMLRVARWLWRIWHPQGKSRPLSSPWRLELLVGSQESFHCRGASRNWSEAVTGRNRQHLCKRQTQEE